MGQRLLEVLLGAPGVRAQGGGMSGGGGDVEVVIGWLFLSLGAMRDSGVPSKEWVRRGLGSTCCALTHNSSHTVPMQGAPARRHAPLLELATR